MQIFLSDYVKRGIQNAKQPNTVQRANPQKWLLSSDNMRNDQTQSIVSCKSS
jgi:hypothetical protein